MSPSSTLQMTGTCPVEIGSHVQRAWTITNRRTPRRKTMASPFASVEGDPARRPG